MRETRYLWISNLPVKPSEDDVCRDVKSVLESHGKIQSVRIHENGDARCAVVAFMDTKSATKALEFVNKLEDVLLNLEYCESTGLRNNSTNTIQPLPLNDKNPQSGNVPSTFDSSRMVDDRKTRSPERSQRARSRSSSDSSTLSELSSVTGLTKHRTRHKNHKSSDRYHSTGRINMGESRGLSVTKLPLRSTDSSIREGLFHEYKKHGKITSVQVEGQGPTRSAVITFKRAEDAEKALDMSRDKIFFAAAIHLERHPGFDIEDPDLCPPEIALDEFHPKATKTLFVGNLSDSTTDDDLTKIFDNFGDIIDIDIKQQTNQAGATYAFIQYTDIRSVVKALHSQNIRVSGKNVKLGFGKSQPTNCVWLDNLAAKVTESLLTKQFGHYGVVLKVMLDKKLGRALVFFDSVEAAQKALSENKAWALAGQVHMDYANAECQAAFGSRGAVTGNGGSLRSRGSWNHTTTFSSHDAYRTDGYPLYYPSYTKNSVSYMDDRSRRRDHEDYEDRDPVYVPRSDTYRDGRRVNYHSTGGSGGWTANFTPDYSNSGGNNNTKTSTGGKTRLRYADDIRSSSGVSSTIKKAVAGSKVDSAINSRIRSVSPFSVKSSSRSQERDLILSRSPVRRSKDPSVSRASRTRSTVHQEDMDDDDDRLSSTTVGGRVRTGASRRKSGSDSRSHRSNSLSDRGRESLPRRGHIDTGGSSGNSGHPDSSNSEGSPGVGVRSSLTRLTVTDSPSLFNTHHSSHNPNNSSTTSSAHSSVSSVSRIPAKTTASVSSIVVSTITTSPPILPTISTSNMPIKGEEQSVECLTNLERERQMLLIELSRLTDSSSAAPALPSSTNVDQEAADKKCIKIELRDVFDYDFLHEHRDKKKLKSNSSSPPSDSSALSTVSLKKRSGVNGVVITSTVTSTSCDSTKKLDNSSCTVSSPPISNPPISPSTMTTSLINTPTGCDNPSTQISTTHAPSVLDNTSDNTKCTIKLPALERNVSEKMDFISSSYSSDKTPVSRSTGEACSGYLGSHSPTSKWYHGEVTSSGGSSCDERSRSNHLHSSRPSVHIPGLSVSRSPRLTPADLFCGSAAGSTPSCTNSAATSLSASHIPSTTSPSSDGTTKSSSTTEERTFDFTSIRTAPQGNPYSVDSCKQSPPIDSASPSPRDPRLASQNYLTKQLSTGSVGSTPSPTKMSASSFKVTSSEPQVSINSDVNSTSNLEGLEPLSPLGIKGDDSSNSESELDPLKDSQFIEERIRLLDNKLFENKKSRSVDYSKYKIRKIEHKPVSEFSIIDRTTSSATTVTSSSCLPASAGDFHVDTARSDTSEFVKSMLSTKPSSFEHFSDMGMVERRPDYVVSTPILLSSVSQPLTIGISTGDSSTPSSLSSPGSASLPSRNLMFNTHSSSVSQGSLAVLTSSSYMSGISRLNSKIEIPLLTSSTSVSPITIDPRSGEPRSILKKDAIVINSNSAGTTPNHILNNNNNSHIICDGNGTTIYQRVSRPLVSPSLCSYKSTNGGNTYRLNGTALHTPPIRTSDSQTPTNLNSITPSTTSFGLSNFSVTTDSKSNRPGQNNPSPKNHTLIGNEENTHNKTTEDRRDSFTTYSSTTGSIGIKRKVCSGEDGKKSKISRMEERSLEDNLFQPESFSSGKEKKHKKIKSEHSDEKLSKKSNDTDYSKDKAFFKSEKLDELARNSSDAYKFDNKKNRKHSPVEENDKDKHEKHKRKKEREREKTMEKLFGDIDDLEPKKKGKKKHQKDKEDSRNEFSFLVDKYKKEKKKHSHDKEKHRINDENKSAFMDNQSSKKEKSRKHDEDKKRKEKEKEKVDSDSDEGWRLALQAVADDDIMPYESMYDKIKRRASKEAEKRQQSSSTFDNSRHQKKSKLKHRKSKNYGSDSDGNQSDSMLSTPILDDSTRSSGKKIKLNKFGKIKTSKLSNLSDDDMSNFPVTSKKMRLDDSIDEDSIKYGLSKLKKKKKISEDSLCRRKSDPLRKSKKSIKPDKEEKHLKLAKSDEKRHRKHKKSLISVDSVFSDSSPDTSRASSPVRGIDSLHDHSSDESKTTPSTEPMEVSEGESNSNPRKSTEDDWKSSLPPSPLREEQDHRPSHRVKHRIDSKKALNDHIAISEDLPCLEKQSEEELVGKSPLSIDDEPPDHLESIYDSPRPSDLKDTPCNEQIIEEAVVYDNMELTVHDEEAEQSLAIASILDKSEGDKSAESTESKVADIVSPKSLTLDQTSRPVPQLNVSDHMETMKPLISPTKVVESSKSLTSDMLNETPSFIPSSLPAFSSQLTSPQHTDMKLPVISVKGNPASTLANLFPQQLMSTVSPSVSKPTWDQIITTKSSPPVVVPKSEIVYNCVSTSVPVLSTCQPLASTISLTSTPIRSQTSLTEATTSLTSITTTVSTKSRTVESGGDARDYTSYVQSVIERVKQEKDEESQHGRDRSLKRQKKYTSNTTSTSGSSHTSSQPWSLSQERRHSGTAVGPTMATTKKAVITDIKTHVPAASSATVPSIPGVNVCTPVLPQHLAKVEALTAISMSVAGKTPAQPAVLAMSNIVNNTNPVSSVTQIVPQLAPLMTASVPGLAVTPQLATTVPILPTHLNLGTPIASDTSLDRSLTGPTSPLSSTPLSAEAQKRRLQARRKRSGSLSKSNDQLVSLDKTIDDVVRKSREGSATGDETGKRVGDTSMISTNSSESLGANRDQHMEAEDGVNNENSCNSSANRLLLVDPYEPNFDDSPPSQINLNLNRDLHRGRPPSGTVAPPPVSTSEVPTTVASAAMVTTITSQSTPDNQSPTPIIAPSPTSTTITPSQPTVAAPVMATNLSPPTSVTPIPVSKPAPVATPTSTADSVSQVIEDVCQGRFDTTRWYRARTLSGDERSSLDSPMPSTPNVSSAQIDTQLLNAALFQQQHQQLYQTRVDMPQGSTAVPLSMFSLGRTDAYLATALPNNPMLVSQVGGQVQMIPFNLQQLAQQQQQGQLALTQQQQVMNALKLGVTNSQPYTGVQQVEERGYPIERVPNPSLAPLSIGTSIRPGSVGPTPNSGASTAVSVNNMSSVLSTSITSSEVFKPQGPVVSITMANQSMSSPVLVSRPSSNPTGRMASGMPPNCSSYAPTTPDHSSPNNSTSSGNQRGVHPHYLGLDQQQLTANLADPAFQHQLYLYYQRQSSALSGMPQENYLNLANRQEGAPRGASPAASTGSGPVPNNTDFSGLLAFQTALQSGTGDGRPPSQSTAQFLAAAAAGGLTMECASDQMQSLDSRFGVVWKGRLALKNEEAHVQMNFVHGNHDLIKACMTLAGHSVDQPLKIVQRMRLEATQLEGVQRKMQQEAEYCVCLALASGSNPLDLTRMTGILRETFIKYLQEKMAAGIINVCHPEYNQGLYVVHIFPPCEFSNTQLQLCEPKLLQWITQQSVPHLLVVITTV